MFIELYLEFAIAFQTAYPTLLSASVVFLAATFVIVYRRNRYDKFPMRHEVSQEQKIQFNGKDSLAEEGTGLVWLFLPAAKHAGLWIIIGCCRCCCVNHLRRAFTGQRSIGT